MVGTPYNPNPCTPRTPHPPTKEQTLEPSARKAITCHLYVILYLHVYMLHVMTLIADSCNKNETIPSVNNLRMVFQAAVLYFVAYNMQHEAHQCWEHLHKPVKLPTVHEFLVVVYSIAI